MPTGYITPSRPTATPMTGRVLVSTGYTSDRKQPTFLMTQLLDYLMTQDNNYIMLQNSSSDTIYTGRPLI